MTKNQGKFLPADLFIQSPFWQKKLQNLLHPVAIRMAQELDQSGVMGIGNANDSFWKGFKHDFGKKDSNIDFLLRIKAQHPQKIILVQIGEFFETWAIDSVFLVEHCGINRMGRKGPRAGMPLANIQSVLDDLIANGFSVVVCQQADESTNSGKKLRFISEIITASSPTYTYGLAMNSRANAVFAQSQPEFGISLNSKGVKIAEINPDLQTTLTLEGLTLEAASIHLNKYGARINRIFIDDKINHAFLANLGVKCDNLITISNYLSKDFAKRMEELIKIDLAFDAKINFLQISQVVSKDSVRPIYQTTAKQIGILPKVGIPNLIDLMLPKGSPSNCKNIIRNLLLNPPSELVASSIRQIINELQLSEMKLPNLIVSNPARYVKTLNKKEAHPEILKDLFTLANIFTAFEKAVSKDFINHSLNVVSHICSVKAESEVLAKVSSEIIRVLDPILPHDEDLAFAPKSELISKYFFENIEDEFRGRVSRFSNERIAKLYAEIEKLAQKYEEILIEKLNQIVVSNDKKNISLSFDIHNKAIWLSGRIDELSIKKFKLIHPLDRYNKQVKDRFSFKEAENILEKYKNTANQIAVIIKELLREISLNLSAYSLPIIHLATFSNLIKTLYLHAKECAPKDWSTNFILNGDEESQKIVISEFFPYWIRSGQAVKNSLTFDGACLLTGHNMSGKSTTMRSIASVTLLGSCGFMFPAQKLEINCAIDGWFVRTGAQDDPEAGLSAFAVEMSEMKVALRDASNKSLLLIDELGKGTESKAGHAIAASILEHLAKRNIRCIFATHWHEIFANPIIDLQNIKMLKMKCDGDLETYKLVDGIDLNSAAFYSAAKIGIDEEIISRAKEIQAGYHKNLLADIEVFSSMQFAKEIFASAAQSEIGNICELKGNENPSLIHANCSVVYVLKTANNFFYVGETDNFSSRVKAHRYKFNKCEFLYIILNKGKSHARKLEQELILKLKTNNFPMISTADESNLRFGLS